MVDLATIRADLAAEHAALDAVVAGLDEAGWRTPTASPGWGVAEQIAHLTYFDGTATAAIVDPDGFSATVAALLGAEDVDAMTIGPLVALDGAGLLAAWREGRAALLAASEQLGERDRVPWYGPSMGAKSFLTARLMETWAHGTDVADALGVTVAPSDRLGHIARLGVNTRGWTYANRREEAPTEPVRVTLTAPSGDRWELGDPDAEEFVEGPALDFCLVTSQRRHLDDTALATSPVARHWLERAQLFAGPATDGPPPGGRV